MDLTKENIRKLRELILFTAVVIVCLWKYETTFEIISFVWNVIFPFILGGAIAFILNVPMCFLQRHLFPEEKLQGKKGVQNCQTG